jgi:hypothetical protein
MDKFGCASTHFNPKIAKLRAFLVRFGAPVLMFAMMAIPDKISAGYVWQNYNISPKAQSKPLPKDFMFSADQLLDIRTNEANDKILAAAKKTARSSGYYGGHCYRSVKRILRTAGISLGDMTNQASAYMAAGSLAEHSDFMEIKCDVKDITCLPDGAIIVWGKSRKKPHGHIEIKCGKYGLCDVKYPLRTSQGPYGECRIFVLKSMVSEFFTRCEVTQLASPSATDTFAIHMLDTMQRVR